MKPENGGENNGNSVAAAAASLSSDDENWGENGVFIGDYYKAFDLEDLLRASAHEVLGKGTFGTAYKAVLEIGIIVAVKRLKDVGIMRIWCLSELIISAGRKN